MWWGNSGNKMYRGKGTENENGNVSTYYPDGMTDGFENNRL